jgi:hypothetical protein
MKHVYAGKRRAILANLTVVLIPTENNYIMTDGFHSTDFATERELRRAIFELRKIDQDIKVHWLPAPGIEGVVDFAWVLVRLSIMPIMAALGIGLLQYLWH